MTDLGIEGKRRASVNNRALKRTPPRLPHPGAADAARSPPPPQPLLPPGATPAPPPRRGSDGRARHRSPRGCRSLRPWSPRAPPLGPACAPAPVGEQGAETSFHLPLRWLVRASSLLSPSLQLWVQVSVIEPLRNCFSGEKHSLQVLLVWGTWNKRTTPHPSKRGERRAASESAPNFAVRAWSHPAHQVPEVFKPKKAYRGGVVTACS